jgi:hypothetical protein
MKQKRNLYISLSYDLEADGRENMKDAAGATWLITEQMAVFSGNGANNTIA